MFLPYDIFTSSGTNTLYGCWTSDVSKFDTSSFYNWEEDNLPLFDLEERTHLLWERLGHPTSSMTGFSFVVSAEATSSCNSNVFTSLSACISKLPEVINAPYLIEIASFGHLGELIIPAKKFGAYGSIEIINRNFASIEGSTSSTIINKQVRYNSDPYGLASAVMLPGFADPAHVTYIDAPSLIHEFLQTSCVSLSATVFSGTGNTRAADARLLNNLTVFSKLSNPALTTRLTASLAADNSASAWTNSSTSGTLSFLPFEYGDSAAATHNISTYDVSTINELTDSEIVPELIDESDALAYATTWAYGNRVSKIKIENCNGPIFIRNFTVDGLENNGTKNGIEIVNSTNVYLDKCSAARCTEAGLFTVNSKVTILRGFIGYRNYNYNTDGTRAGLPYLTKIAFGVPSTSASVEEGAGIKLVNSELNLSSTSTRDTSQIGSRWSLWDSAVQTLIKQPVAATGWLFCLSKNFNGIEAYNSRIFGGQKEIETTYQIAKPFYNSTSLFLENNRENGLKLVGSQIEYDGKLIPQGNFRGIEALGSNLLVDTILAKYNQKEGILMKNSSLKYNKNLSLLNGGVTGTADTTFYRVHHNSYWLNGVHVKLNNSLYEPTECSSMPTRYERFVAASSFGVEGGTKLPSIILENNSKARLIHPGIQIHDSFVQTGKPLFGQAVSVATNSELYLQGTSSYATKIVGPSEFSLQQYKAGLFATDNSKIKISGPTVVAKYAIGILALNNSEVEIVPHKSNDGTLDIDGMNLATESNHTIVELHSTRSCIVVDKGSILNIKDVGDYRTNWANGAYGSSILLSSLDYDTRDSALNLQLYTSAGSIQFYPNPNESGYGAENPTISLYSNNSFTQNAQGFYTFLNDGIGDITAALDFSSVTLGGFCVRALNNSQVNLHNVHFPAGWWNPSATIYDAGEPGDPYTAEGLCSLLFIWNIADNSLLNAKYISVSGTHPADTSYHGPSGVWGSASGAPISTPDTSSVSILDYFGPASNHIYGKSSFENAGPFRLYFSHQPEANWLLPSGLNASGNINQVFAQGYQFSAPTILPGNLSAVYPSLLRNEGGSLVASGFYYGSSMLTSPFTVKAILDDSAANTFANAKHCAVGKSGLGRVTAIYYPYTNIYGGDSANAGSKSHGRGYKSSNSFDLERDN